MNGQSEQPHKRITTEDLKAITQAPKSEEPLVTEGEFPVELARSSRPIWTKPIPKLAIIGILLVPVFGVAALLLAGGRYTKIAQKPSSSALSNQTTSQPETAPEELARLREENSKLKANAAIGDQGELQNRLAKSNQSNQKLPRVPVKATSNNESSKPIAIASTPPRIVSQTSPPKLVSAPMSLPAQSYTPVIRSSTVKSSSAEQTAQPSNNNDSMEQWQQLAQLGSYGTSSTEQSSGTEWSNASHSLGDSPREQTQLARIENSESSLSSIPTARIAATSAIQANDGTDIDQVSDMREQLNAEQADPTANQSEAAQSNQLTRDTIVETQQEIPQSLSQKPTAEPPILEDAEAAILQEANRQHSLIAGESAAGVLATPLTLSDSKGRESNVRARPDQFTIVLSQPLKDSTEQIAMPTGAHLLVQVEEVSKTGQVQLAATTAVWNENGMQKELTLPAGAIQVRGENGKPLVAKQMEDRGKEIAAMDTGQFLLGAVRRSAQLFTRSNSQIQTGNGTTVITENNPAPNLLAGALEGGTDAVLTSIDERNKQAIKEMQQRPNALFIASGSPVQVFVNQSMLLPN